LEDIKNAARATSKHMTTCMGLTLGVMMMESGAFYM